MAKTGHMTVTFLRDYEVKDEHEGTPRATKFREGAKRSLPEASALHFISRGIAEETNPPKT